MKCLKQAMVLAACSGSVLVGCNYRHTAEVKSADLPPPPVERVLHTSRLLVEITPATEDAQCVAYEGYRTLCFDDVRTSLAKSLSQALWPSFPEVVVGRIEEARGDDYVLQVEVALDALPPDDHGPGWSAGARSRYRLMRGESVLLEETLASRSRAEFAYGSALGQGASEVVDATAVHVATAVSQIDESQPRAPRPLPAVAAQLVPPSDTSAKAVDAAEVSAKPSSKTAPSASTSAKTAVSGKAATSEKAAEPAKSTEAQASPSKPAPR